MDIIKPRKIVTRMARNHDGQIIEVPAYIGAPPRRRQSDFDRERMAQEAR